MKFLKAVVKSFRRKRREPKALSDLQKAREEFINSPAIRYIKDKSRIKLELATEPIDERKIQEDSTCLMLMMCASGYAPDQVLHLLAKTYGALMANAPDDIELEQSGKTITVDDLKEQFFKLCELERIYYVNLKKALLPSEELPPKLGSLH